MSVPQRVVGDYHVDRQEVYARRRVQLTCTNGPSDFLKKKDKPRMKEAKLSIEGCGSPEGGLKVFSLK